MADTRMTIAPDQIAVLSELAIRTFCDACDYLEDDCRYCTLADQQNLVLCPTCREIGWPRPEPSKPPTTKNQNPTSGTVDLWPIVGYGILGFFGWFLVHSIAPQLKVAEPDPAAYQRSKTAFVIEAAPVLSLSRLRFDDRRAGNVVVFVDRAELESIPYPDREAYVEALGRAWCENLRLAPRWLIAAVPSLRLRDIDTGKPLGSYTCVSESWAMLSDTGH